MQGRIIDFIAFYCKLSQNKKFESLAEQFEVETAQQDPHSHERRQRVVDLQVEFVLLGLAEQHHVRIGLGLIDEHHVLD